MHRLLYTSCVSNTEVLNCFNPRFFCSVVHVFVILISINVFCFQLQFSLLYISMISIMCSSNVCTLNNHIILQYSLMGVKSAVDKSTGRPKHQTYRSCSAIQTHEAAHSFCADGNARRGFESEEHW